MPKHFLPALLLPPLHTTSADGHYELRMNTKAIVHNNGLVAWLPPATYKSACDIDVEYFPLDIQTCFLKLGSWTYAGSQVSSFSIICLLIAFVPIHFHSFSFIFIHCHWQLAFSV